MEVRVKGLGLDLGVGGLVCGVEVVFGRWGTVAERWGWVLGLELGSGWADVRAGLGDWLNGVEDVWYRDRGKGLTGGGWDGSGVRCVGVPSDPVFPLNCIFCVKFRPWKKFQIKFPKFT